MIKMLVMNEYGVLDPHAFDESTVGAGFVLQQVADHTLVGLPSAEQLNIVDSQITTEKKYLAQYGAAAAIYLAGIVFYREELGSELLSANPFLIVAAGLYVYGAKTIVRNSINSVKNIARLRRQRYEPTTDGQLS